VKVSAACSHFNDMTLPREAVLRSPTPPPSVWALTCLASSTPPARVRGVAGHEYFVLSRMHPTERETSNKYACRQNGKCANRRRHLGCFEAPPNSTTSWPPPSCCRFQTSHTGALQARRLQGPSRPCSAPRPQVGWAPPVSSSARPPGARVIAVRGVPEKGRFAPPSAPTWS